MECPTQVPIFSIKVDSSLCGDARELADLLGAEGAQPVAGVDVDEGDVVVLGLHAHLQRRQLLLSKTTQQMP